MMVNKMVSINQNDILMRGVLKEMTREEIYSLLNESFAEAIKDNKQQRENYLKLKHYRVQINEYSLWKYEVSEAALKQKNLPDFIEKIDRFPIEDLISGQAYHNKSKKLLSITVKPIKTTFIVPYYMSSIEGTLLFPSYKK